MKAILRNHLISEIQLIWRIGTYCRNTDPDLKNVCIIFDVWIIFDVCINSLRLRTCFIKRQSHKGWSRSKNSFKIKGDPIFSTWKNHTIFSTSIFDHFLHLDRTILENTKISTTALLWENTIFSTYFWGKYQILHTFRF